MTLTYWYISFFFAFSDYLPFETFPILSLEKKNEFHSSMVICIQNSRVNNVSNVIIIQRANTKSSVRQHGPPSNAKEGSGAMEE
jgi:hypothetical protein